jgi:F0F1-type ATP synthase membrane subunit a
MLLAIIGGFAWTMICTGGVALIGSIIPIGLIFILTFLELSVSLIQAYVFTVLTIIYLNDAINLH